MAPSPTESAFHNRQLRQWQQQVSLAASAAAGSPGSSSEVGCGSPISPVSHVGYSPVPDSLIPFSTRSWPLPRTAEIQWYQAPASRAVPRRTAGTDGTNLGPVVPR